MLIYVAHPIDRANQHNRTKISGALAALGGGRAHLNGHHLYLPSAAFKLGPGAQPDTTINTINGIALSEAQAVLALWPADAKSWGVPVEVDRAYQNRQRVAMVVEEEPTWAMCYGEDVKIFKTDPKEYDAFTMATLRAMDWLTGFERTEAPVYKTPQMPEWVSAAQHPASGSLGGPGTHSEPEKAHEAQEEATEAQEEDVKSDGTQYIGFRDLQGDGFEDAHVSLPTRGYHNDAGLDIYVSETTVVLPHTFADVRSHTAVNLPTGTWGYLVGRSSTLRKKGLMVNPGVIDNGYTGELYSAVWNLTSEPVKILAGERVAQLILMQNITPDYEPQWVGFTNESVRGDKGFGSSGA